MNQLHLADIMIELFMREFEELHGRGNCSYNCHQKHLVDAVRRYGPISVWSAFPFEDANGYFKKINHGPNKIDMEIMNTLKMLIAYYILKDKLNKRKKPEYSGELILGSTNELNLTTHELEVFYFNFV